MAKRGRGGALDMNFDGLADSITNLVGALILLVVLIIGVTKDAVSQVDTAPARRSESKSDSGQESILPLQRRIALLQTQIKGVETDIQAAAQRLEPLREQVEELLQKVEEIQPPKNEPEPPKEKTAKEIPYRPPFERLDVDRKAVKFIVEEGRVSLLDLAEVQNQLDRVLAGKAESVPVDFELPASDFRIRGKASPTDADLEVVRKPDAKGETWEEAAQAGSKFRQKLAALDANANIVSFDVYPDSYDQFRELRALAWGAQLDVGWAPLRSGEIIKLSYGPGVNATQ